MNVPVRFAVLLSVAAVYVPLATAASSAQPLNPRKNHPMIDTSGLAPTTFFMPAPQIDVIDNRPIVRVFPTRVEDPMNFEAMLIPLPVQHTRNGSLVGPNGSPFGPSGYRTTNPMIPELNQLGPAEFESNMISHKPPNGALPQGFSSQGLSGSMAGWKPAPANMIGQPMSRQAAPQVCTFAPKQPITQMQPQVTGVGSKGGIQARTSVRATLNPHINKLMDKVPNQ
jgi:hypothetical protein